MKFQDGQDVITMFILCVKRFIEFCFCISDPTPRPPPPLAHAEDVFLSIGGMSYTASFGRKICLFRQSAERHTHLLSFQTQKKRKKKKGRRVMFMLVKACSVRTSLIFQPTPSGL